SFFMQYIGQNFLAHARGRDILVIGGGGNYPQDGNRYYFVKMGEAIPADAAYDMIILHGFFGAMDAAFLQKSKAALKTGGTLLAGFYTAVNFSSPESRQIDAAMRTACGNANREIIIGPYDGWADERAIVLYSCFNYAPAEGIYTDNLNRSYLDRN